MELHRNKLAPYSGAITLEGKFAKGKYAVANSTFI
jgi:hypothetical protein